MPRAPASAALVLKTLGGSLEASGDLTWAPALAWDLKVRGKDLNPAGISPGLEDRIGLSLDSKGGLAGFGYDLMATSQGPGLPPARLRWAARATRKGTEIETLRLEALKGRLEGRARAAWDPRVTWEADLTARGSTPGPMPRSGRAASTVGSRTQGSLEPKGPNLTVGARAASRGPCAAIPSPRRARCSMAGGDHPGGGYHRLLGSQHGAGGRAAIAETLDLRFDLASPDLASLLPGAKGSVQAKGQVRGAVKAPADPAGPQAPRTLSWPVRGSRASPAPWTWH